MLKRFIYLLLLSLALLLLMSLMVVSAETEAPEAVTSAPVQAVMLPRQPSESGYARDAGGTGNSAIACAVPLRKQMPVLRPVADANGVPVAGKIYCVSAYFAFCLSASAG